MHLEEDLEMIHHYFQILGTRSVMKCFSAHSGMHGFALIWHIISNLCAIWVHVRDVPILRNYCPKHGEHPLYPNHAKILRIPPSICS